MSISPFDGADNCRVVNLSTGEMYSGSGIEMLDVVLPKVPSPIVTDASSGAQPARFSPDCAHAAGIPASGGLGLVMKAITGRAEIKVFADAIETGQVDKLPDASSIESDDGVGSLRGEVTGYSSKSRRRFIYQLAKARDFDSGYFVTLTFPDSVVAAFETPDDMGKWAKECWAAFRKRLLRREPDCGGFWRLEFKPRKSGIFKGFPVPHIHLLVRGCSTWLDDMRGWVSQNWYEVVGSDDVKHWRAGTNVRVINNRRHASAYVSKYAAKLADDDFKAGRRWGSFGKVDTSPSLVVSLSAEQLVEFRRLQRKLLKARGSDYWRVLRRVRPDWNMCVLGMGDSSSDMSSALLMRMLAAVGLRL